MLVIISFCYCPLYEVRKMPQQITENPLLNQDPLLSDPDAERYIACPVGNLKVWRCKGKFTALLKPLRIGRRVFYRKSTLDNFLAIMAEAG